MLPCGTSCVLISSRLILSGPFCVPVAVCVPFPCPGRINVLARRSLRPLRSRWSCRWVASGKQQHEHGRTQN